MIDKATVQHIAKLARLKLSEAEEDLYTAQLGNILQYFEELKAIDTTGVEPMSHAVPLTNVLREDAVIPSPGHEKMLSQTAAAEREFFKVPRIGE
jgi:aspartyl-tRNA(Asn)/glutamyl-tRNA(Gln) amidotransferase subunit C